MKKSILLIPAIAASMLLTAQVKKKPATTTSAHPQPILKTNDDSISYAIGLSVANFFKQQNIKTVNTTLVSKAINDIMKNGSPVLNEQQANNILMACVSKAQAEKNKQNVAVAEANKKVGEAFLAENKTKPGVVTLPSGLQYQVLKEGDGPKPAAADKIKCLYEGKLLDGTVFDSSDQHGGQPLEIGVSNVIPGWTEALQLMPVGSKWRLFIPSNLAYGDQQAGPLIKPGSTLIFDVELLEIVK